jgi:uncharacterized protein
MPADYKSAKDHALERLAQDLSPQLFYHSLYHTRDEVLPAVRYLAEQEGVVGDTFQVLMTAAFYHDIGFIVQYQDHETASAMIAAKALPQYGFSTDQLEIIQGIIMATRLPQSPNTLLEKIMADADLDVLGKPDFLSRNQDLRRELEAQGHCIDDLEWYTGQVNFLKSHPFKTRTARERRGPQKQRNLAELEQLLLQSQEKV